MPDAKLRSWPPRARDIVLEAARFLYRQMNEPFPVYDASVDEAVAWVNDEIAKDERRIYEEASPRWIDRWERGSLDPEIREAVGAAYGRLRRAERGLRSHARKRPGRQLDAEIAQALAGRRR